MTDARSTGDSSRRPEDQGSGDAESWVAEWSGLFADEPVLGPEARSRAATGSGQTRRPSPGSGSNDEVSAEAWQQAQERSRRQARVRANQRAARQLQRLQPGRHSLPLTGETLADSRWPPRRGFGLAVGAISLVVIVALLATLLIGIGEPDASSSAETTGDVEGTDTAAPIEDPVLEEADLSLTVGADVAPASIEQLTASTVQLFGLDDDLLPVCAGSGVIVGADGTILTNAHVVTSGEDCRFSTVGVAVTVDAAEPPELLYVAEVVALGPGLDLAVLRVTGPISDEVDAPWPTTFDPAPLGDSDTVELGDSVRILGYPVIGGETITLTTGTVSGFTSQVGLGNRALIKTDATISAGNSGGMAVDPEGRVIGIPTRARASDVGPAVDCRPIEDTNEDGEIDDDDTCVSVGGFLNGIRPINLSLSLLAAAGVTDSAADAPVGTPVDLGGVVLSNPRFSLDVVDDEPIDRVRSAPAGIPKLCFFFDWNGIPTGAIWDGVWYIDDELQSGPSAYVDQSWAMEADGEPFWLCIEAEDESGLDAGIYELAFVLDGTLMFVEAFEITPEAVPQAPVRWINGFEVDICGLAINPAAASRQVGLDEMPPEILIEPGGEWTVDLPLGSVVVEAYDCSVPGVPVADQLGGLVIDGPQEFLIGIEQVEE